MKTPLISLVLLSSLFACANSGTQAPRRDPVQKAKDATAARGNIKQEEQSPENKERMSKENYELYQQRKAARKRHMQQDTN